MVNLDFCVAVKDFSSKPCTLLVIAFGIRHLYPVPFSNLAPLIDTVLLRLKSDFDRRRIISLTTSTIDKKKTGFKYAFEFVTFNVAFPCTCKLTTDNYTVRILYLSVVYLQVEAKVTLKVTN